MQSPDYKDRAIVESELKPGETILWLGKPSPLRTAEQEWKKGIFGIALTVCTLFAMHRFAIDMTRNAIDEKAYFTIFSFMVIGTALYSASAPIYAYYSGKRSICALTQWRIIIVINSHSLKVDSYGRSAINKIVRKEYRDGSGTLTFAEERKNHGEDEFKSTYFALVGIDHVADVEALLRQIFSGDLK